MELRAITGIMLILLLISMLTLAFNVQSVKASGTIYIRPDGSVDPPTASIQRVGDIYIFTDNIYEEIVVERDNIVVDGASYTLQGTGADETKGINLLYRKNVTIKNMEIEAFGYGIWLYSSYRNTISENIVTNNGLGIALEEGSFNNIIHGNNITENSGDAIWLYWIAYDNIISANNITNNGDGIWIGFDGSSGNVIFGNNIINNDCGINLSESSYNTISGNSITNNNVGIFLGSLSCHNTISGNNITNNGCGVVVYFGPFDWYPPEHNTIYHNNFINNTEQVDSHWGAAWDNSYPSGGNYWSDYTDVDLYCGPNQDIWGSDGIWDHPYVIDEVNQDNYPLINPWGFNPPFVSCYFDFGTSGSPVETGYTRVTQATAYSLSLGYGWSVTSGLDSRDRGAPDSLRRDFVFSSSDHTFNVDLANGDYHVTVVLGDQNYMHDLVDVYAEGEPKLNDITTSAGQFAIRTFIATVIEGKLDLMFADDGGSDTNWVINSLIIEPVGPVPLSVSVTPASVSMTVAQSQMFTASAVGGTPPYSYQWYLNGSLISGAVDSTWTFSPVSIGTYLVLVLATDDDGSIDWSNIASITVITQQECSLSLDPGWNMVSFPCLPDDPSFSSILADVGFYQILTWDGTSYISPTVAEAGVGYWVLVLEETSVEIENAEPVTSYTKSLSAGWSMIGSIYEEIVDASTVFPGFYQLLTWDGTSYVTATTIEPGKGYWALVLEPTTITVGSG